jgi:hypothetical protein
MRTRIIIAITILCFGLFGAIWLFNHISAWLGLLTGLISFITAIRIINIKPPSDNEENHPRIINNPYCSN